MPEPHDPTKSTSVRPEPNRAVGWIVFSLLVIFVIIAIRQTSLQPLDRRIGIERKCDAVMGTTCTLGALSDGNHIERDEAALAAAEDAIRRIEGRLSSWIDTSEIARLNSAAANEAVPLSEQTLHVLRSARDAYDRTGGVFDITCRPQIELWREAGKTGRVPTGQEIQAARMASSWADLELTATGAIKHKATVRVDLGGIAKGYAIDRAFATLREQGVESGMVEIGGDVLFFGTPPAGQTWAPTVKDPRKKGAVGTIVITGGAVCTSGDYARNVTIDGKQYSHIIDPGTGRPAEAAMSVTVLAPTAEQADIWATALSVLGPEGLKRMQTAAPAAEAMMIIDTGGAAPPGVEKTAGFPALEAKAQ